METKLPSSRDPSLSGPFNFLASLINGNTREARGCFLLPTFNFLASLINGNKRLNWKTIRFPTTVPFNFLASLINGNLQPTFGVDYTQIPIF